jgi:hypothetical protein
MINMKNGGRKHEKQRKEVRYEEASRKQEEGLGP